MINLIKQCATCAHFTAPPAKMMAANLKQTVGICKLNPPQPMIVPGPSGPVLGMVSPQVQSTDACGQHNISISS